MFMWIEKVSQIFKLINLKKNALPYTMYSMEVKIKNNLLCCHTHAHASREHHDEKEITTVIYIRSNLSRKKNREKW